MQFALSVNGVPRAGEGLHTRTNELRSVSAASLTAVELLSSVGVKVMRYKIQACQLDYIKVQVKLFNRRLNEKIE